MPLRLPDQTQTPTSFCDHTDVRRYAERFLRQNPINLPREGKTEQELATDEMQYLNGLCADATKSIVRRIRTDSRWAAFARKHNIPGFPPAFELEKVHTVPDNTTLPPDEATKQRMFDKTDDFNRMAAYFVVSRYLVPIKTGNAEADPNREGTFGRYYQELYDDTMSIIDWYDVDESDKVEDDEEQAFVPDFLERTYF